LNSKARELAEYVQGVKYFLKVYQRNFERKALAFDFDLQGRGGVPVPSARVKEIRRLPDRGPGIPSAIYVNPP
jgi:hypothetical protein